MAIKAGDRMPAGKFKVMGEGGPQDLSTAQLFDDELRVGAQDQPSGREALRRLQSFDDGPILGDVVGRVADRLAVRGQDLAVLVLEDVGVGGRAGIAARAAVGEEARLHASCSGITSNAGSS